MLDIIQHNPYRLLGVFATATRREIVANLARIKANIRVNRQVSFPVDLDGNCHHLKEQQKPLRMLSQN